MVFINSQAFFERVLTIFVIGCLACKIWQIKQRSLRLGDYSSNTLRFFGPDKYLRFSLLITL